MCGAEGRWHDVSATMCRWLRVRKVALLLWNWRHFIHPEDRDTVRAMIDALQRGDLAHLFRCRLVSASGEIVTVDIRLIAEYDAVGEHDRVRGSVTRIATQEVSSA